VRLWSSDELVLERTNTGHCLGVASVAAHPSGHIAASASLDSFVQVFDVATIATLEAPPSEVWQLWKKTLLKGMWEREIVEEEDERDAGEREKKNQRRTWWGVE
jgi:WD40 repeat protein